MMPFVNLKDCTVANWPRPTIKTQLLHGSTPPVSTRTVNACNTDKRLKIELICFENRNGHKTKFNKGFIGIKFGKEKFYECVQIFLDIKKEDKVSVEVAISQLLLEDVGKLAAKHL